jgi:hypothetical protein
MVPSSLSHIQNRVISMASILFSASTCSTTKLQANNFRLIDGFDTLDLLEKEEVNKKHRPLREIRLKNVTIHANPLADESM